jgi:hypothetical protein
MRPDDVLDKDVYDANGHRLGHVDLAREMDGFVLFDVRLSGRGRRLLHADDHVVTFSAEDVIATDDDVTLAQDAAHLMRFAPASTPER